MFADALNVVVFTLNLRKTTEFLIPDFEKGDEEEKKNTTRGSERIEFNVYVRGVDFFFYFIL